LGVLVDIAGLSSLVVVVGESDGAGFSDFSFAAGLASEELSKAADAGFNRTLFLWAREVAAPPPVIKLNSRFARFRLRGVPGSPFENPNIK